MINPSPYCTDDEWQALIATYPELLQVQDNPAYSHVLEGLKTYGLKEWAGEKSNPAIDSLARDANATKVVNDDAAWCSAWLGGTLARNGNSLPPAPGWSFSYLRTPHTWPVPLGQARMGDLAVFGRNEWEKTLGHPVIVIRLEDYQRGWPFVHGLGGNQSNRVSIQPKSAKGILGVVRFRTA